MFSYKHFLIAASMTMTISICASNFTPKRRKIEAGALIRRSPRTPERPITGRAYLSHLFDHHCAWIEQSVMYLNAERKRADALAKTVQDYETMKPLVGLIVLRRGRGAEPQISLLQVSPAFHTIMEFLRPEICCKKNYIDTPSNDPLLPDQSVFDE